MTYSFIYPQMIEEIRSACSDHIAGSISADDLQRVIRVGEATIVALEERDIRNFLTDIESRLEMVKFTVDSDRKIFETKNISSDLLIWLSNREAKSA